MEKLGEWSFILGVVIAVLAGLFGTTYAWVPTLLVVLGVLVGLLNISDREITTFLIAAIALVVGGSASLGSLPTIGAYLGPIMQYIATFVAPAAVIVALKAVYELGKKK